MKRVMAGLFAVMAIACGGSSMTPAPSPRLTASLPSTVSSRLVTCNTCTVPPFSWQTADFTVAVSDPTGRGGTVASVDAVVRNLTRVTTLGQNRVPNASVGLANSSLPAAGTLMLGAGVTFGIPPAASDELQLTVTVTLTDGRTASATSRVT